MPKVKHTPMPQFPADWVDKFWGLVDRSDPDGCWPWMGGRDGKGYGTTKVSISGKSISLRSHRVSYFLSNKVDPGEYLVCHSCDNPPCCNPRHHFLGMEIDNHRDAVAKGRYDRMIATMPRGESHPWFGRDVKGELSPNARITESDVRSILNRYKTGGVTQCSLAREFSISQPHISEIIRRVSWKHLVFDH